MLVPFKFHIEMESGRAGLIAGPGWTKHLGPHGERDNNVPKMVPKVSKRKKKKGILIFN